MFPPGVFRVQKPFTTEKVALLRRIMVILLQSAGLLIVLSFLAIAAWKLLKHKSEAVTGGWIALCMIAAVLGLSLIFNNAVCAVLMSATSSNVSTVTKPEPASKDGDNTSQAADIAFKLVSTVGIIAAIAFGVRQIWQSNSIRTAEVISKIYQQFASDELHQVYDDIRNGKQIVVKEIGAVGTVGDDERRLNQCLTLFDEIDFLLRQGLLKGKWRWRRWRFRREPNETWEFLASEVQYFALNDSVWDYIVRRIKEGQAKTFPKDIIPFTGFPELLESVPAEYRAEPFPSIPNKHKDFFNELKTSR